MEPTQAVAPGQTAEEQQRQRHLAAWVADERRRKPGSMNKREKLARGQREEALGLTDPPERKPKFIKISPGIHVQTRGPVVIGKLFDSSQRTGEGLPWWIFRLPGTDRLTLDTERFEILERVGAAEEIAGPLFSFGEAKGVARKLIAEANGEMGS